MTSAQITTRRRYFKSALALAEHTLDGFAAEIDKSRSYVTRVLSGTERNVAVEQHIAAFIRKHSKPLPGFLR